MGSAHPFGSIGKTIGIITGDSWSSPVTSQHTTGCWVLMGWREHGWRLFPKNPFLGEAKRDPWSWLDELDDECKYQALAVFLTDLLLGYWGCLSRYAERQKCLGGCVPQRLLVANGWWVWKSGSIVCKRDKLSGHLHWKLPHRSGRGWDPTWNHSLAWSCPLSCPVLPSLTSFSQDMSNLPLS